MDTITYILLGLTILMLIIGLIIEYKPREKEEERIAAKARSSQSDPGPFEPPTLYIKKITYDTIPLKIAYLLPDISDEAIQQAMDFCKRELLKSAANSIDYRIEDCFPGDGKKLTARLIVANSQSSRDADC